MSSLVKSRRGGGTGGAIFFTSPLILFLVISFGFELFCPFNEDIDDVVDVDDEFDDENKFSKTFFWFWKLFTLFEGPFSLLLCRLFTLLDGTDGSGLLITELEA